jgi:hypothetical protein
VPHAAAGLPHAAAENAAATLLQLLHELRVRLQDLQKLRQTRGNA